MILPKVFVVGLSSYKSFTLFVKVFVNPSLVPTKSGRFKHGEVLVYKFFWRRSLGKQTPDVLEEFIEVFPHLLRVQQLSSSFNATVGVEGVLHLSGTIFIAHHLVPQLDTLCNVRLRRL